MISGSQLTEERLRNWLDSNQVQRERLCIALLSLNKTYSSIKPRRPKGGPDGGRDIEAIYQGRFIAYGAVGFRNSVSDSPDDKRWVQKKFSDDLLSALKTNKELKAFIFFTNIDLTPAEEESLILEAKSQGVLFTEVFYRERLRILLDSVEGLAARYIYLGISLSEAEQAAFFERFGSQLEELIISRFKSVDNKLARLEFLQETTKPVRSIFAFVQLKNDYPAEALRNFRVLFKINSYYNDNELYIGGESLQNRERELVGRNNFVLFLNAAQEFANEDVFSVVEHNRLVFGCVFNSGKSPFINMGELEQSMIVIYVTKPLIDQIIKVGLVVNGYALLSADYGDIDFSYGKYKPTSDWPFSMNLDDLPLYGIYSLNTHKKELLELKLAGTWSPFRLEFGHVTPIKLSKDEQDELLFSLANG